MKIRLMNNFKLTTFALALFIMNLPNAIIAQSSPKKMSNEEGWIMRKNSKNNQYERFFAIGTWRIPGYEFDNMPGDNGDIFRQKTQYFNIVFVATGQQKDYMQGKIHMVLPFSSAVHGYLNKIKGLPTGEDKDYYRSQYLKVAVNDPAFEQAVDSSIDYDIINHGGFEIAFSNIDELAIGGGYRWCIPPSVGAKIYDRVKRKMADAIVYVDLVGHARGNTYLFEQLYLQNHASMPKDPPYELLSEEARKCKIPLLGFYQAYNGFPVYEFKNGSYYYKQYDFETLKSLWYENTKRVAVGYKGSGNVFGINAYGDFREYPLLSGITVDALREGLGTDVPIWLYFDGNGYAKPANMSVEEYVKNVTCQMYTSIIHGATGIFFWNDPNKTSAVFDAFQPVLKEMTENVPFLKLKTIERRNNGDLHLMIKQDKKGKKWIFASNTSKTDVQSLSVAGVKKKSLLPLEVYVASF